MTTDPIVTTRARDEHDGTPCAECRRPIIKRAVIHVDRAGGIRHAFRCPS